MATTAPANTAHETRYAPRKMSGRRNPRRSTIHAMIWSVTSNADCGSTTAASFGKAAGSIACRMAGT